MTCDPNSELQIVNLQNIFLKSYIRANIYFPQTRFYFILELCSRLTATDLQKLSDEQLAHLGIGHIQKLLDLARKKHQEHHVEKPLQAADIQRDISKSLAALRDFLHLAGTPLQRSVHSCQMLIAQCQHIKDWIDDSGAAAAYLQFLSPVGPACSLRKYQVLRLQSPLPQILSGAPDCSAWRSLRSEIDKQIWVIR